MRHREPEARSYAVTHPSGVVVVPQPDGWDQLLLSGSGTMTVRTADSSWLVPPHRGVWVPSGVHHQIVTSGRVQVRSLYLASGVVADPGECRAVELTPFTRELFLHAIGTAPLWSDVSRHAHLLALLADEIRTLDTAPLRLPMPTDERALHAAGALIDDPSDDRPVDDLARAAATSRRTLERLFVDQTGMSLGRWRTQVRMHAAITLLEAGVPVTRVAVEVGYSTPSAFGAAFRQAFGTSPSRYLGGGTATTAR